jgi:beta-glucosidase
LREVYENYIRVEKAKLPKKRFAMELLPPIPEMPLDKATAIDKALESDIAFITIGRNSGEFQDRELDGDFYLTAAESSLIETVSEAFHAQNKRVVILLNIGNVIEVMSWRDHADAIMLAWQGGQEAGNAIADVLTGKVNPSGKLPTTFAERYKDYPSAEYFPGKELPGAEATFMGFIPRGTPSEVKYEEGIWVGYRHFVTHESQTAYPFGYGLSYTTFEYPEIQLTGNNVDGSLTVRVKVSNTGKVAGREVVQLYVSAPGKAIDKPAYELKGFAKTRLIQPGSSETVEIRLTQKHLASFHEDRSAWIVEPGEYRILAASSSEEIRTEAAVNMPSELIVEKVHDVLKPSSIWPE